MGTDPNEKVVYRRHPSSYATVEIKLLDTRSGHEMTYKVIASSIDEIRGQIYRKSTDGLMFTTVNKETVQISAKLAEILVVSFKEVPHDE